MPIACKDNNLLVSRKDQCWGHFCFLLYINDIVNDTGSNICLFADDSSVYIIIDDPVAADPVSRKINRPLHPLLSMLDQQITEIESHKHLGIYLSNDCTWHKHIEYIKEKAWNRINIMRKLKFELGRQSFETFYVTFIRPVL